MENHVHRPPRLGSRRSLNLRIGITPKKPGQYTLLARAKDADGMLQPDEHDQNYGVYVINHSLPIEVFIDGSEGL